MLNIIVVQGRLTRDPEVRSTQTGSTIANFTLACDRDWQPGGTEKQADFIDCAAFRQTAGFVERNFRKGQLVLVKGSLHSRKWQDRDGNRRVSWEIAVDDCWFSGDRAQPAGDPVDVPPPELEELGEGEGGELPF